MTKAKKLHKTGIMKRIVGMLLTILIILPIVPVTEVKALTETETLAENTSSTIDIYRYIANYILDDEADEGMGTSSNREFEFWLYDYTTTGEVMYESFSNSQDFVNSVKAWEYINIALDPSSVYSKSIDIRKYYSSIILDMLECSYTEDTYVNAVNNENVKDSKNAVSIYNQFCKFYKEYMKADITGNSFLTEKQKNDLLETQKAFLKENKLLQTGEAMDNLFKVLKAASTGQECIESFISYCNVATVCDEWKHCLQYMYDKCDKSNYMLSDTLSSFVSASKSIDNAIVEYWKEQRSNLISALSEQAIGDLLGLLIDEVPFLKGMQIGAIIGKSLSNMLCGTDEIIEKYYITGIYCQILELFKLSMLDVENTFIDTPTTENARTFLVYINMLYSTLKLGNTYGMDLADTVCNKGLINSLIISKDNYEAIKKSNANIDKYLDDSRPQIFTDGIYALEDTDPETYNCYAKIFDLPLVKINVPVTGVSVEKDEIVIDLSYSIWGYNEVTIYPENATDKGYKMRSADTTVVSDGPMIEGRKVGETTMTVTTNDGGYTAVFKIRVIDSRSEVPETDYTQFKYSIRNDKVTITGYNGTDTVIKIPSKIKGCPVTSIGYKAFSDCTILTSVTIPDSVTYIGSDAFGDCTGLTSLVIPDSVTTIGSSAFSSCTNLETITIPKNAKFDSYGGTFDNCTSLKNVKFSSGIEKIPDYLFYGSSNLNSLTSITIPNSVTSIGYGAFSGCTGLPSITIPDCVTYIGTAAFIGCTGLTSITIPDSVTSIDVDAFSGCTGLTSIIIPDSVTTIGGSAFYGCTGLASIIIPDSVTSVSWKAFSYCTGLTSVTIPDSVTTIRGYAFFGCTGLTSITIPDSVTSIGEDAFYGCTGLTSITIPDSVTTIGDSAFYSCTCLTSIIIPDSVTSIGYYAFNGCKNLTIYCYPNSYAVTYARSNNIPYKFLEEKPNTSITPVISVSTVQVSENAAESDVIAAIRAAATVSFGSTSVDTGSYELVITAVSGKKDTYSVSVKLTASGSRKYTLTSDGATEITVTRKSSEETSKPVITNAAAGDQSVYLEWTAVSGAEKYAVYYTVGGKWYNAGTTAKLSMSVTGLTNGTKYGFAVKAYVNGAWTGIASSDIVYATPVGSATVVKPKITKAEAQDGRVALNWTTVDGATNYAVYTYLNGKWTVAGYRTAAGMYVTGLTNGTKYGFAVKAYVNGAWTGITSSDIVYATPVGSAAVKPVITKAQGQDGKVALNWTAVDGATNYAVYSYLNGKWSVAGYRTATGMYVTGLTNGTKYGFAVKAYVNGAWTGITSSDIVYATPVGSAAVKPVITKAQGQDGRVALNWPAVDGATNYAVYTYLNGKWSVAGYRTATGMYVTGLTNGTRYGFAVKAYVNGAWTSITSSDIVYAAPTAAKSEIMFDEFLDFIDVAPVSR